MVVESEFTSGFLWQQSPYVVIVLQFVFLQMDMEKQVATDPAPKSLVSLMSFLNGETLAALKK